MVTYYDASQAASVTLSGNNVTAISDLSGGGRNGTAEVNETPVYTQAYQNGLNVLSYAETSCINIPNSIFTMPQASVGWVFKTPHTLPNGDARYVFQAWSSAIPSNGFDCYLDGGVNPGPPAQTYGTVVEDAGANNVGGAVSTGPLAIDTWYRMIMVWDSTAPSGRPTIYINGAVGSVVADEGSGSSLNTVNAAFGAPDAIGNGRSLAMKLGECFWTLGAVSTAQVASLDSYWTTKWALPDPDSFTPLSLTNLNTWYDLSNSGSITTSGSLISRVNDISGNGNYLAQSTSANQLTLSTNYQNGLSVALSNASAWMTSAESFVETTGVSFAFLIQTPAVLPSSAYIVSDVSGALAFSSGQFSASIPTAGGTITTNSASMVISPLTWYRIYVVLDSTLPSNQLKMYINGIQSPTVASGNNGIAGGAFAYVGLSTSAASWTGYYAEMIWTGAAFSALDRSAIDNYWHNKWSI